MDPLLPDPTHVIRIIRQVACSEIMPRFRNLHADDIAQKRHARDLVTIADTEAERVLIKLLCPLSPGSAAVGEEGAEINARIMAKLGEDSPVWLIDPVDGTMNFAAGTACFAVIVAYCVGGKTLAGWIHDPIADTVVWAVAGEGAWLEQPSGRRSVRLARGGVIGGMKGSLTRRAADRLYGVLAARGFVNAPEIVRYGSVGREYMDLGRGVIQFAQYTRLKPWDHAAGVLIHHEAGGFSRLRRDRSPYRAEPRIVEETLLLAPDEATWRTLDEMLG
jgi:fructose-1,6-bisphosphatase/inositol monophosphatase family enzyme